MGLYAYNQSLIKTLPDSRTLTVFSAVLGVVFGVVSTAVLSLASSIQLNMIGAVVVSLFFYLLPAAASTGVFLVISAFLLVLTFRLYDFIIQANVTGISAMDFTSVLMMRELVNRTVGAGEADRRTGIDRL